MKTIRAASTTVALLLLVTLVGCKATAYQTEGTSFESTRAFGDPPPTDVRFIAAKDIILADNATVVVLQGDSGSSPADVGFISCGLNEESKVKFFARYSRNQPLCSPSHANAINTSRGFETSLLPDKKTYFTLGGVRKNSDYIAVFTSDSWGRPRVAPRSYVRYRLVDGAINVIGDPFDSANDPNAIADAIRKQVPRASKAQIVTADKVIVNCRQIEVSTVIGPSKSFECSIQ